MNGYIGEVRLFSGNFAPRGWGFCSGAILDISQYQALYSLIGTLYGGNGRTTFALPDGCGRVAVGMGQVSKDAPNYRLGDYGGSENVTLDYKEMPIHAHKLIPQIKATLAPLVSSKPANTIDPKGNYFATTETNTKVYSHFSGETMAVNDADVTASISAGAAGDSQAHTNIMPIIVIHYIICLEGEYPHRHKK